MPYNESIVRGDPPRYDPEPGAHPLIAEEVKPAPAQKPAASKGAKKS